MATNSTGVYQKNNGFWEYRFIMMVDGRKISKKKSTDAFGNKLKTKKEAIKAREAAMAAARNSTVEKPKVLRRTVAEVYEEYCEKGRKDRAYQTIRKQDSLWKNHLFSRFGNRFVDEISSAEVVDYLEELYYIHNFSYQYTEAFLKMFYLIFGQAYSRNYLDVDYYNKLCVNKDSLTNIIIPDSVTSIGGCVFYECTSLTSITIGDSVTSIGNFAFYRCNSLTDFYYDGTYEQWYAIQKGYNWINSDINYTVHCTTGYLGYMYKSTSQYITNHKKGQER